MSSTAVPAWPYPLWIAHRGAGQLLPENTLAAFRAGQSHGYRMFECDAKLSADGVLYLMHDATLDRTTSASGPAAEWEWSALSQLDAGSWHSPQWAAEPLPTLANLLRWCRANELLLNIEIKAIDGQERATGRAVAQLVAALWSADLAPPLLSSFQVDALAAAQAAQPEQPLALLAREWNEALFKTAQSLQCQAVTLQYELWSAQRMEQAKASGLRTLAYTVNEQQAAQRLQDWGIDGIITDCVAEFAPHTLP